MPYANLEDRIKCAYRWRKSNPEKFVASTEKYYRNHKPEIQKQQKQYRDRKKEERIHKVFEYLMDLKDGFKRKKAKKVIKSDKKTGDRHRENYHRDYYHKNKDVIRKRQNDWAKKRYWKQKIKNIKKQAINLN